MKKKILVSALALSLCAGSVSYAASDWAVEDLDTAGSAGLLSEELLRSDMTGEITRREFCSVSVALYEMLADVTLARSTDKPFSDTDSQEIAKAYRLGIVSGFEDGTFRPDEHITREQMAVMIYNTLKKAAVNATADEKGKTVSDFTDADTVSSWAYDALDGMLLLALMNGVSETEIMPSGTATREQAAVIAARALEKFCDINSTRSAPKYSNGTLSWKSGPFSGEYLVVATSKADGKVTAVTTDKLSISLDFLSDGEYRIVLAEFSGEKCYAAPAIEISHSANSTSEDNTTGGQTGSSGNSGSSSGGSSGNSGSSSGSSSSGSGSSSGGSSSSSGSSPGDSSGNSGSSSGGSSDNSESDSNPIPQLTLEEKYARVFAANGGVPFDTKEIADQNMTTVKVNIWKLEESGEKTPSTMTLTVNSALADEVVQIFDEIFADPEQFPFIAAACYGYSFRPTSSGSVSEHSYGTCIDLNPDQNYMIRPDGTIVAGSHWLPGEDPYSIPEDSSVVRIFAKYGWAWGGNAWSSNNDYMHFTYLGR